MQGVPGEDGNGITSSTNNGDGTFTLTFDDETTFTTDDLTGPQGPQGIQGDGSSIQSNSTEQNIALNDGLYAQISLQSTESMTYVEAIRYCANLVESGFDDWALGNYEQWESYIANTSEFPNSGISSWVRMMPIHVNVYSGHAYAMGLVLNLDSNGYGEFYPVAQTQNYTSSNNPIKENKCHCLRNSGSDGGSSPQVKTFVTEFSLDFTGPSQHTIVLDSGDYIFEVSGTFCPGTCSNGDTSDARYLFNHPYESEIKLLDSTPFTINEYCPQDTTGCTMLSPVETNYQEDHTYNYEISFETSGNQIIYGLADECCWGDNQGGLTFKVYSLD